MISVLCSNCGVEFEARRCSAKYCSPACRQQSYREAHGQVSRNKTSTPARREDRLTCPHCGKGYWQSLKGRKRSFCSDSCRVSANRRKVNATRNLIRKLSRRGANLDPYVDAANEGTAEFEKYVKRFGFVYDHKNGHYFEDARQSDFYNIPSKAVNFGKR